MKKSIQRKLHQGNKKYVKTIVNECLVFEGEEKEEIDYTSQYQNTIKEAVKNLLFIGQIKKLVLFI